MHSYSILFVYSEYRIKMLELCRFQSRPAATGGTHQPRLQANGDWRIRRKGPRLELSQDAAIV